MNKSHCPKCGKFCSGVHAQLSERGIEKVTGRCKKHGWQDITNCDWDYEDFDNVEDDKYKNK